MTFFFFLLHFSFVVFIIFVAVPPTMGQNTSYTPCSKLYSCGEIQDIGYPFWGDNRPKYCGIPAFKLSCDANNTTSFDLIENISFGVNVTRINSSSHTMKFSLDVLFKFCFLQKYSDIPILSTLKLVDAPKNITLFYDCDDGCVSKYKPKNFTCSTYGDGSKGTAYYFGETSEDSRKNHTCSCKNNVTIPVDKKGFDELRHKNASLKSILMSQRPEVKYKANFTACSNCEKSNGTCGSSGSSDDPLSDHFVCYCPDGTHPPCSHSSQTPHISEEKKRKPNGLIFGSEEKKHKPNGLIFGSGIGGAILVFAAITVIWHRKKLKFGTQRTASLNSSASELEKGSIYFGVPLFSYSELVEATANFDQSNELGNGGFGIVFYGKLKDGREVAVKRLYEKSCKRVEQFMNEVQILTCLRHQNLVSLYGCTSHHCKELLLVYEYVKNGTVSDHLYGKNSKSVTLPWPVRLRIAIETATALSYLHASDIVHRDVKTNNILLDNNFGVKVADFGLSRLFPTDVTHVSTAPQGTPGYLDPEYHQCYQLTNKSDVYSFGVVLVELISSLPAIDMNRDKHEINLSNYAMNRIQRCAFDELVDPQLGFAYDFMIRRMTTLVAELAFQCLQHDKEMRPPMEEVLEGLKRIESADYEALLLVEETTNIVDEEMVRMPTINPRPSVIVEDDHAQLLSNHQLFSSSPVSVIKRWVSNSTTTSTSK